MRTKLPQHLIQYSSQSWKQSRPDKRITPYDNRYIEMARELYQLLGGLDVFFDDEEEPLSDEHRMDIAMLLIGWFEDFINEWNIWSGITAQNEAISGSRLLFPISADYDPDYINAEDIQFLLWAHISILGTDFPITFEDSYLKEVSIILFDYFEDRIESMPATQNMDKWLTILPGDSFFDIRYKVEWLTIDSILFKYLNFLPEYTDAVISAFSDTKKPDQSDIDYFTYNFRLIYLYNNIGALGMIRPIELAAQILTGPEEILEKLVNTSQMVPISATYQSQLGPNYQFTLGGSKRKFEVAEESMEIKIAPGQVLDIFMIKWGDEYYFQGMGAGNPAPNYTGQHNQGTIPYILLTDSEREIYEKGLEEQERAFLQINGSHHIVIENEEEFTQFFHQYYQNHLQILAESSDEPYTGEMPPIPNIQGMNFPTMVNFRKGLGVAISPKLLRVMDLCNQNEPLNMVQEAELFHAMVMDLDVEMVNYIYAKFPSPKMAQQYLLEDWWENVLAYKSFLAPGLLSIEKQTIIRDPESWVK